MGISGDKLLVAAILVSKWRHSADQQTASDIRADRLIVPSTIIKAGRGAMGLGNDFGGTVREFTAEETLARLKPILAELGITRLANITGLDTIRIPVWTVVRPLGRS